MEISKETFKQALREWFRIAFKPVNQRERLYAELENRYASIAFDEQVDCIDPSLKTNKGVKWFMFNKVRTIMKYKLMSDGYPSKISHHNGYYSGIGLWIADGWMIHSDLTWSMWHDKNNEFYDAEAIYRYVYIVYVGNEYINCLESAIPLSFDSAILSLIATSTKEKISIYKHIMFPHTMNNKIIARNWDYIVADLNKWGY